MKKDLTGQRFGKLVAIQPLNEYNRRGVMWECKCDCGKTACVVDVNLTSGGTKSCGCARGRGPAPHDWTGEKIGRLTVLGVAQEDRGRKIVWECRCDCGNVVCVGGEKFSEKHPNLSCGCYAKDMEKQHDLTGRKFGRLTVLRRADERRNGAVMWECKCDCGAIKLVSRGHLTSGSTRSCGCLSRERRDSLKRGAKMRDLAGKKFGQLTAIRPTEKRSGTSVVWECRCDCGNTKLVSSASLVSGAVCSCGCVRKSQPNPKTERVKPAPHCWQFAASSGIVSTAS